MAFTIRFSMEERVVRSTDDNPGIMAIADHDDGTFSWVVHNSWEPFTPDFQKEVRKADKQARKTGLRTSIIEQIDADDESEFRQAMVEVGIADVAAGIQDLKTCSSLAQILQATVGAMVPTAVGRMDYSLLRRLAEFAEQAEAALSARYSELTA